MDNKKKECNLSLAQKKILLKTHKKKKGFKDVSQELISILLSKNVLRANIKGDLSYELTDVGTQFFKELEDELRQETKSNIISLISLISSVVAILISLSSFAIDIFFYFNKNSDITKESIAITSETTDIFNTAVSDNETLNIIQ